MKYISLLENRNYAVLDGEPAKTEKFVEITDEVFSSFFEEQAKGKQFRIKNINRKTFKEIFEEVIEEPQEPVEFEPSPVEKLQEENLELKKEIAEQQVRSIQAIAELTNLILATQIPQA